IEQGAARAGVEVLGRAADRDRAHDFGAFELLELAEVVGDVGERLPVLAGELGRADRAMADRGKDLDPSLVTERFDDPGIDDRGRPGVSLLLSSHCLPPY